MTTGLPTSSGVQAVPTLEPIRCATEVACGMAGCCSWCPFSFTQCDWSAFTRVKTDNKDDPERLRTRTPSIMHFWQSPRERHQLECGEAKTRLTGGGHLILTLTTGTCLRWLHRIGARKKDAVLVWDGGVKSRAHGEATRRCYLNLWGSSGHSSAALGPVFYETWSPCLPHIRIPGRVASIHFQVSPWARDLEVSVEFWRR